MRPRVAATLVLLAACTDAASSPGTASTGIATSCTSRTIVLGPIGHNDTLVVDTPVPLAIRPPSNFYWRSNPYAPNGGGEGTGLPASTDFRFTYWLGRFTRRTP